MNSSNTVRNYKCDVSGKSKDLSSDIVERDERTFDVIEELNEINELKPDKIIEDENSSLRI